MNEEIAKLIIESATCAAAIALVIATGVLVKVTRQHARHAEQLALAASRLADILDQQGIALADASDLNALVRAKGMVGNNHQMQALAGELEERRASRLRLAPSRGGAERAPGRTRGAPGPQ